MSDEFSLFLFFTFLPVFLMPPTHDYGKGFSLRASFAMSDKNPSGIFSALQLDGDFVSPYPRPQSQICVLVSIYMVTVR